MMNITASPLFRERPASRVIAVEALSTVPFISTALLYRSPADPDALEWAQLAGLAMAVTLYVTALRAWRLAIVTGLRPAAAPGHRLKDERRLRLLVLGLPILVTALLPIPAAWSSFWFWFTLISAAAGAVSAVRLLVMLLGRPEPR
ncbi:hypothetical protein ACFFV7_27560 [Nonomuraea spiralis]|uniref:Uncharacterized protein n=1 Tax=Nonomuraea spiralis TaxID=46182 RepID=A0ABV5IM48_9ACTN|nr:hypothetical protein [Nonomuraea spiralis]GGT19641.1 hypothetical protein GCM10010176_075220 [Nonomuraea spiralis]